MIQRTPVEHSDVHVKVQLVQKVKNDLIHKTARRKIMSFYVHSQDYFFSFIQVNLIMIIETIKGFLWWLLTNAGYEGGDIANKMHNLL